VADHAHTEAPGPPPFALSHGLWLCTVEGQPQALWVSDVDATGPIGADGSPANAITCRQVTALELLLIARKVYNLWKIIRYVPLVP
jgi:hypothetical protein